MRARARESLSFKGCLLTPTVTTVATRSGPDGCAPSAQVHVLQGALRPGGQAPDACSALARLLGRVDRDRDREIERGAHDAVLLDRVSRRIALARRGALGPADVPELQATREDVQQARGHVRAGAHVARLLLDPTDLAQVRVALDLLEDLRLREGVEQLDARDRDPV